MGESYSGKQFFFIGKTAANRDLSDIPPLDPRSYILQPGLRPLKGEIEPSKKAVAAVEDAINQLAKEAQNAR
jgi:hypothetical protein